MAVCTLRAVRIRASCPISLVGACTSCTLAGEFNSCSARQSATIRRLQRLCPRTLCKEVVMYRKTMIALATVAALGALTPTATAAIAQGDLDLVALLEEPLHRAH